MKIVTKYVSILGKEFATAAAAMAHEDRLPALIAEWKDDLVRLRSGTMYDFLGAEDHAGLIPSWEKRVAEFEAQWAEVQKERADMAWAEEHLTEIAP